MSTQRIVLGCLACCLTAGLARADEVDDLVRRLRPPARFAGHTPRFTVQRQSFTFTYRSGPRTGTFALIKDGPRHVALIPMNWGGTIYVLDFNPRTAPRSLRLSGDRWRVETSRGSQLRTDAYIPRAVAAKESSYAFTPGDGTLTLVRRFKGTATFKKWSHKSKSPETVDQTNTFVFRCDPVLGYVVEGTFRTAVKPAPERFEYFSATATAMCSVWATEADVSRTVMTPTYRAGFEGYGLNFAAIDWCDRDKAKFTCRDGGFGAFLNAKTGWSPATTIEGSEAKLVVCNAHADLDFVVPWAANARVDADGFSHQFIKTRVLALPPEVTTHLWNTMRLRFEGRRRVMIRIGVLDDFEDQPLPLTCGVRALTSTGGGPKITEEHAHSGKKSIVIPHGRFWPNLPQIPLKGGARYRLSAWIKLVAWTPAERAARAEKLREKLRKRRAAGKDAPDFKGFGPAEACITADTYVSSPHQKVWVEQMRTNAVKPGGWRKATLELTAAKWAPFLNIAFIAEAGTAYVDDFELVEVKDATPRPRSSSHERRD